MLEIILLSNKESFSRTCEPPVQARCPYNQYPESHKDSISRYLQNSSHIQFIFSSFYLVRINDSGLKIKKNILANVVKNKFLILFIYLNTTHDTTLMNCPR